VAKVSTRVYFT